MATRLIATQAYPYAGRSLATGDEFDASDRDADLLKRIGRAVDAPSRTIQTRDLTPEAEPSPDAPAPAPRMKRQYRRRDLTAEP